MQTTSIEWAGCTVNPLRAENRETGSIGHFCERISPGCKNCYAAEWQQRFAKDGKGTGLDFIRANRSKVRLILEPKELAAVVRRLKPTDFFWCDMTDLFGDWVSQFWLDACLATMILTSRRHTHKLLTKRPDRARDYLLDPNLPRRLFDLIERCIDRATPWPDCRGKGAAVSDFYQHLPCDPPAWPPQSVLIGTSVENQTAADARYAPMKALCYGGWFTWVSAEPLLETVDLTNWFPHYECEYCGWRSVEDPTDETDDADRSGENDEPGRLRLADYIGDWQPGPLTCPSCGRDDTTDYLFPGPAQWVVAGGESGRGARRMPLEAPRLLRDQCVAAGVPFLFKQWGHWCPPSQMPPSTAARLSKAEICAMSDEPYPLGKKRAGRLLDGREWNQLPEIQTELQTCPNTAG